MQEEPHGYYLLRQASSEERQEAVRGAGCHQITFMFYSSSVHECTLPPVDNGSLRRSITFDICLLAYINFAGGVALSAYADFPAHGQ